MILFLDAIRIYRLTISVGLFMLELFLIQAGCKFVVVYAIPSAYFTIHAW